ncbi:hypothetical protein DUI87_12717 [Hirundo rustica rustica]|uniref:EF-hand domain-containing protein n=1 Tax=Hirundo rustica rustica TaxID=333673 RepID=A0A3M0KFR6_HIRRU|nr:hypothetical protein DUI87_12717 [Hirundo rustica rustica]
MGTIWTEATPIYTEGWAEKAFMILPGFFVIPDCPGALISDVSKTRPENLPSPTDRSKLKHGHYEAGTKEEYKQHPQRIAEKKKDHFQCPDNSLKPEPEDQQIDKKELTAYKKRRDSRKILGTQLEDGHDDFVTLDKKALLQQYYTSKPYNMQYNIRRSEAEDVAVERKKQAVLEQVMVDQLCRAVVSDPEQFTHSDACKEAQGLLGVGIAPMRFRKRTLHETKASSVELKEECSRQVDDGDKIFKKIQGLYVEIDFLKFQMSLSTERGHTFDVKTVEAYMKLDFNKTGSVPMVDVRKCYCPKKYPLVLAGKTAEEDIKSSFLEALGESCRNLNEVSYSEFEDYYESLSFGIVDDDDFVSILRNSWGI